MTRDERQEECLQAWLSNKCVGSVIAATGFGKTRVATNACKLLLKQGRIKTIVIVVPTNYLKDQWEGILKELSIKADVYVVNTVITKQLDVDLLILDEIHLFVTTQFIKLFKAVKYKAVLGLTATIERLDGKEVVLKHALPVVATVPLKECKDNEWVSPYAEYVVTIKADLSDYYQYDLQFKDVYGKLGGDFTRAMDGVKELKNPNSQMLEVWARELKVHTGVLKGYLSKFNKSMRNRTNFLYNNEKKIEVARKIIEARPNTKTITFGKNSKSIKALNKGMARSCLYYSGMRKSELDKTLQAFILDGYQIMHSVKKLIVGADIPNLALGIKFATDSNPGTHVQQVGRVIRRDAVPFAEFFTIVIDGTQDIKWIKQATKNSPDVTYINEYELYDLLKLNNE